MIGSSLFWIDAKQCTYADFHLEITRAGNNSVYVQSYNPYEVFVGIIRNAINQKNTVLLDADFSDLEVVSLGISSTEIEASTYFQPDLSNTFSSVEKVIHFIKEKSLDLNLELFTSGTTGRPKQVNQNFKVLTQGVKLGKNYQDNVWGFCYNPTHYAGLQVFFQALFNVNTLVYLFDKDMLEVVERIKTYQVTNISSTPSFLKLLLAQVSEPISSIERITTGGEKMAKTIQERVKEKFPKAVLRNVYASTEAGSLLVSMADSFTIPERYTSFIKIDNEELLVHKSLMGSSESIQLVNDWYRTGDLIEWVNDTEFRFKSRKSEMINVGGYKVNPAEIEELIMTLPDVEQVKVYGRQNSVLGYVIAADVKPSLLDFDKKKIKQNITQLCTENLQEFKVPRVIKFVDTIELTRTGKLKR